MLSLFLTIMVGCSNHQYQQNGDKNMDLEFKEGIYHEKTWDESIGTYKNDIIPDKKIALQVAVQIFEGMQKSSTAEKYVPQTVFYDREDELWIVSFWEDTEEEILGGDCNIALQKKDGKVLRIWFGE